MNFFKRNRNIIIAIVLFFVAIIFCVQIKNILIPNSGVAVYGNRLDGEVKLTKNLASKIKETISDGTKDVKIRKAGKIVNVTITVYSDVSRETAKAYAQKAMESFTTEEKAYYDIQFYLLKDGESTEFPIMGYSIQNTDNIAWTKDR